MSQATELELMAVGFRARGFHVVYPAIHGSLLVAAKPEDVDGIRVFGRSVHIMRENDSWSTFVGGIALEEYSWAEDVENFVCRLLEGSDDDCEKECQRRRAIALPKGAA
jgi:hypothetical protein